MLLSAAPAFSADRPAPDPLGYTKRLWSDLEELPSKPVNWDKDQWYTAGGILALTGGALFFDDGLADFYARHRNSSILRDLSKTVTHFGDSRYQVPLIFGLWTTGYAFNVPKMRQISADAAEASLIAAFLINPAICYVTGRNLPSSDESPSKFRPFTWHCYSFPSGHTAAAFALATVTDIDLRDTLGYWQTPVLYLGAAGVAQSRLYDRKHYLSDVILGGGIGWAVGNWVASKNRVPGRQVTAAKPATLTLAPYDNGLAVAYRF
jgi:membrane-associated phospholipid phosphatase